MLENQVTCLKAKIPGCNATGDFGFGAGIFNGVRLFQQGQKSDLESLDRVASEEIGPRTGLGHACALFGNAFAEIEVIPMVVNDGVFIGDQRKPLEQTFGNSDDRRLVGIGHRVALEVKVADMLDANAIAVGALDARRNVVYAAAHHDRAVGEGREILRDLREATFQMEALHVLAKGEMIAALELLVARHPCVMLLYELDLPRRPLMAQPLVKLRKVHENEFSNCFHRRF